MKGRRPERYATLARVRKHQEEQKALALAQARRTVRDLVEQCRELESHQRRILDEAARQAAEPKASRMQAVYEFERHLSWLTEKKEAEIEEKRRDAEEQRQAFEEAFKKRRIIERLIEKAEEDVRERFKYLTQRSHDEFASIHFARESLSQRKEN